METTVDDKVIALYMGIKWKPVKAGSNSNYSTYIQKLFDTQEECLAYCDIINDGKEPNYAYFPLPDVSGYELLYRSNWEWLMPVVEKIESEGFWTEIHGGSQAVVLIGKMNTTKNMVCIEDNKLTKIQSTFKAVVELLKTQKS